MNGITSTGGLKNTTRERHLREFDPEADARRSQLIPVGERLSQNEDK